MTASVTKRALSSIKKAVILCELCFMPHATSLVICVNILSDLLHSASVALMPGVLTVGYLYPCHCVRNTTHLHQNVIHIENQYVCQHSFLSYWQDSFTCKALSLVTHQSIRAIDLKHSSSPPVTASNMQVILSGHNFSALVNSP